MTSEVRYSRFWCILSATSGSVIISPWLSPGINSVHHDGSCLLTYTSSLKRKAYIAYKYCHFYNSPSFIVSIPCDAQWETWMLLGFFISSISAGLWTCILVWHRSIWGWMPFLTPPQFAGNRTQDLSIERPIEQQPLPKYCHFYDIRQRNHYSSYNELKPTTYWQEKGTKMVSVNFDL